MATTVGHTQVMVLIDTRNIIKKVADADGRNMKWIIDKAVREYAKKHGIVI